MLLSLVASPVIKETTTTTPSTPPQSSSNLPASSPSSSSTHAGTRFIMSRRPAAAAADPTELASHHEHLMLMCSQDDDGDDDDDQAPVGAVRSCGGLPTPRSAPYHHNQHHRHYQHHGTGSPSTAAATATAFTLSSSATTIAVTSARATPSIASTTSALSKSLGGGGGGGHGVVLLSSPYGGGGSSSSILQHHHHPSTVPRVIPPSPPASLYSRSPQQQNNPSFSHLQYPYHVNHHSGHHQGGYHQQQQQQQQQQHQILHLTRPSGPAGGLACGVSTGHSKRLAVLNASSGNLTINTSRNSAAAAASGNTVSPLNSPPYHAPIHSAPPISFHHQQPKLPDVLSHKYTTQNNNGNGLQSQQQGHSLHQQAQQPLHGQTTNNIPQFVANTSSSLPNTLMSPVTPTSSSVPNLLPMVPMPQTTVTAPAFSGNPPPRHHRIIGSLNPQFTRRYRLAHSLGSGGFGFVHAATRLSDGVGVSVKFILREKVPAASWVRDDLLGLVPMEVFILRRIRHENIIRFIDCFQDQHYVLLVTELHGGNWSLLPGNGNGAAAAAGSDGDSAHAQAGSQDHNSSGGGHLSSSSSSSSTLSSHHDDVNTAMPPTPAASESAHPGWPENSADCPTTSANYASTSSPSSSSSGSSSLGVSALPPPRRSTPPCSPPPQLQRRNSCDLFECIELMERFTEDQARHVFRQIVAAVCYLTGIGIVHRDIKDENILIDEHFNVKLIDFGSASLISCVDGMFLGTLQYAAPEIFEGRAASRGPECEVWSLGCCLYIMITGEVPFPTAQDVRASPPSTPRHPAAAAVLSGLCGELVLRMLCKNPANRATIKEVANHPWLVVPQPR